MPPTCLDASLPVAKLDVVELELLVLVELVFDFEDLFSAFLRRHQLGVGIQLGLQGLVEMFFGVIELLDVGSETTQVFVPLCFVVYFLVRILILESSFIADDLHWRGPVVHVNIFVLLSFFSGQTHETVTGPDLVRVRHVAHQVGAATATGSY